MLPEALSGHQVASAIEERFPAAIVDAALAHGEVALVLDAEHLVAVCQALRDEFAFERLSSVNGVDWWPVEPRFEVVYHLHSIRKNQRLRLKVRVRDGQEIDSLTGVWRGANWYEREVFDLFGVTFRNHPNLERIMMPVDWEGHPLRKDFPVHGYKYSYSEE